LFRAEFLSHVGEAKRTYTGLLRGHPMSFAVFQQAPWFNYGLGALEQTQLSMRSPYLDNDFVRTVFRAPQVDHATYDVCLRLIDDGNPALRRIRTDRGVGGSAAPLFAAASRALLEFQFKAEYAYDYGMPQWAAWIDGRLAPLRLQRAFLGRHKFYHYRLWYRDALSGYVREMLLDPRTLSRPYLEPSRVRAIVESHIGGTRNYTTEIHKVLTLELVHRLFIDQK
jgi:asparagine synthase (glutamine-hydrolysing)